MFFSCYHVRFFVARLPCSHYLPEFAQTQVRWVGDAIQPSHSLFPLLLLPSVFLSIRVFSNESAFQIRWPAYWSFSLSISPSNEFSGLISLEGLTDLFSIQSKEVPASRQLVSKDITVMPWNLILWGLRPRWQARVKIRLNPWLRPGLGRATCFRLWHRGSGPKPNSPSFATCSKKLSSWGPWAECPDPRWRRGCESVGEGSSPDSQSPLPAHSLLGARFFSAAPGNATDKDVLYPLSKQAWMGRIKIISEELKIGYYWKFPSCKVSEKLGSISEVGEGK